MVREKEHETQCNVRFMVMQAPLSKVKTLARAFSLIFLCQNQCEERKPDFLHATTFPPLSQDDRKGPCTALSFLVVSSGPCILLPLPARGERKKKKKRSDISSYAATMEPFFSWEE